jgi:hypothetical protein
MNQRQRIRFALCLVIIPLTLGAYSSAVQAEPQTARMWVYGNATTLLSPHWAMVLMPGVRYELGRTEGTTKGHYMTELFFGPTYIYRWGALSAKFSLWYYYMGYPVFAQDEYYQSQNIEFVPAIEYSRNRWTFTFRNIFHNTVYASVYAADSQRHGYGLVLRNLLQAKYQLAERWGLIIADEPFWGLVENGEAPAHPLGFWAQGFRMNRVYAGVEYRSQEFSLIPQYIYETTFNDQHELTESGHYLFFTLQYLIKLF